MDWGLRSVAWRLPSTCSAFTTSPPCWWGFFKLSLPQKFCRQSWPVLFVVLLLPITFSFSMISCSDRSVAIGVLRVVVGFPLPRSRPRPLPPSCRRRCRRLHLVCMLAAKANSKVGTIPKKVTTFVRTPELSPKFHITRDMLGAQHYPTVLPRTVLLQNEFRALTGFLATGVAQYMTTSAIFPSHGVCLTQWHRLIFCLWFWSILPHTSGNPLGLVGNISYNPAPHSLGQAQRPFFSL